MGLVWVSDVFSFAFIQEARKFVGMDMVEVFYHPADVLEDSVGEVRGTVNWLHEIVLWFRRVLDAFKYSCTWCGKMWCKVCMI